MDETFIHAIYLTIYSTFPCPSLCPQVPAILSSRILTRGEGESCGVVVQIRCAIWLSSRHGIRSSLCRRLVVAVRVTDCRAWRRPCSLARDRLVVLRR